MEYRWIEVSPGRKRRVRIAHPAVARSALACPMIIRDFD